MQETWVRSLIWEDPTRLGATKSMCLNYRARILEPGEPQLLKSKCPRARALQQEKLPQRDAQALQLGSSPLWPQLGKMKTQYSQKSIYEIIYI